MKKFKIGVCKKTANIGMAHQWVTQGGLTG